ncbi:MAG TPA: MFS transporter [Spirochaetia bacterium]|nr:MFS transporter [Spirochaetia bacterium]
MEAFKGVRRFLYNLSTAGHALFDSLLLTFFVPFLLPAKEKVDEGMIQFISDKVFFGVLTVLGLIMILGRVVDAVADPLIASWSDSSRSRLGRRRVFLLFGGIPLAVSTVLVYFPPLPAVSWLNAVYLVLVLGCFFFFYTMYVAPYIALIPELGHSEEERIGMTTSQGYFALIGGAVVMIGGPLMLGVFLRTSSPVAAYQRMAVILGLLGAVLLYTAVFAVDEKRFSNAKPSTVSLFKSFGMTIRNKPFILFLIANMCFWYVFNTVRSSALPIGERLMKTGVEMAGLNFILLFAVAGICFIGVLFLSKRIGKKAVMMLGLGSFAVLSVLISLTGLLPVNPILWGQVVFALFGFPVAVLLVLPNVFISELCDYDFRSTGQRREAMYFGVHGFFLKLNLGISSAVLALLYSVFGKDISNPLGVRLTVVVAGAVSLLGLVALSRYPQEEVRSKGTLP